MQKGEERELVRSLFHITSGLAIVLIYGLTGITKNWALIILGAITLFFLLGDIFRRFIPQINHLATKVFKTIMRKEERTKLAASSYYIVGCWAAIFAFSRIVACICILHLVVGDTLTKIIRQLPLEQKVSYRILKAVSVNFLTSFLIAWIILRAVDIAQPLFPSLLGAVGAAVGELIPEIDNLTIPLFSGILLTIGLYLVR